MTLFCDPEKWNNVKQRFPIGMMVSGPVKVVAAFGVFVDLGDEMVGLLRVPEMDGDRKKEIKDYPQTEDMVTAKVLWYDDRNRQVILNQKQ